MSKAILELLAHEQNVVPYRKELNKITGSVTASILLQQIIYWHTNNLKNGGNGNFYKFKEPPTVVTKYTGYKEGDSWTEELGFTAKEFDGAIKKIGKKIKASEKCDDHTDALVLYWRNRDNKTFYKLNRPVVISALASLYSPDTTIGDVSKRQKVISGSDNLSDSVKETSTETTTKTQKDHSPVGEHSTPERDKPKGHKDQIGNRFDAASMDFERALDGSVNAVSTVVKAFNRWSVDNDAGLPFCKGLSDRESVTLFATLYDHGSLNEYLSYLFGWVGEFVKQGREKHGEKWSTVKRDELTLGNFIVGVRFKKNVLKNLSDMARDVY